MGHHRLLPLLAAQKALAQDDAVKSVLMLCPPFSQTPQMAVLMWMATLVGQALPAMHIDGAALL